MKRGLMSLEQQTFKDFEAIFVDDCSTDDTYLQLLDYQQKSNLNIIVLRNVQNVGPGQSRNYAISQAQGKYLAFMDSDDWYENEFLDFMYQQIRNKNAEIIFCDFYRSYLSGEKTEVRINSLLSHCSGKAFVALAFTSLCCLSVKKDIAIKYPVPNIYHGEDAAIIPVWIAYARIKAYVPKALYNYFYRKNSLSTSINRNVLSPVLEGFLFLRNHIDNQYNQEVEFRGICMILYAGVFKAIEANIDIHKIKNIVNNFANTYSCYTSNPYIIKLPKRKRIFLLFVKYKLWSLLKLYVTMQNIYFSIK